MASSSSASMPSSSSSGAVADGIDIEDYHLMPGEGFVQQDRYIEIYNLVQQGNRAFRCSSFDEAIDCYTQAHNTKPGDSIILSNRCAAYIRMSQFVLHRPSSASEDMVLNGLDPTTLAELALKDAEKVMNLQSNLMTAYIFKANALLLLERYEIAREVILSGLQIDHRSNPLLTALQKLPTNLFGRRTHEKPERTSDFDCTICLKLLYEPITTPCGHSFCFDCLFQAMDALSYSKKSHRCPLCRTSLFITPRTCAVSVTLKSIIQGTFPEEYDERRLEQDSLSNLGADLIPLFVMDVVVPCQKFQLNIFEPRYKLMVRRIMEGNHRMGMVIATAPGSIADCACEVEITDCEPQPDGRFIIEMVEPNFLKISLLLFASKYHLLLYVEVESRRRFRILRHWDQDGYRVAEVEWFQDEYPPEGTREREALLEMTHRIAQYAPLWLRRAKEVAQQGRDRKELNRLSNREAIMPSSQDPEHFSFWFSTLLEQTPAVKFELLQMTDTKERLRRGLVFLRAV